MTRRLNNRRDAPRNPAPQAPQAPQEAAQAPKAELPALPIHTASLPELPTASQPVAVDVKIAAHPTAEALPEAQASTAVEAVEDVVAA